MAVDRFTGLYNAAEYFSPFYFPDFLARETTPVTSPEKYFAPDYFSRFYFPSLVEEGPVEVLPPTARSPRDRDGFEGLISRLRSTGVFAQVFFGTDAERRAGGVDLTPAAVVTPLGWIEDDGVDPIELVRTVTYSLSIVVRGNDPAERFDLLDRLGSVAQNAIDGEPLGGVCLPALTRLRRGQFDPRAIHPEQTAVLQGEFTYLVPSPDGHGIN